MQGVTTPRQKREINTKSINQILAEHRIKKASLLIGSNITDLSLIQSKQDNNSVTQLKTDLEHSILHFDQKDAGSEFHLSLPNGYFSLGVKSPAKGFHTNKSISNIKGPNHKNAKEKLNSIVQPPKPKKEGNIAWDLMAVSSQNIHKETYVHRESLNRQWLTKKASRFEQETTLKSTEFPLHYPNVPMNSDDYSVLPQPQSQMARRIGQITSQKPKLNASDNGLIRNPDLKFIKPNTHSSIPKPLKLSQDDLEKLRKQYEIMLDQNHGLDITEYNLKKIGLKRSSNLIVKKHPSIKKSISMHTGGVERRSVRFAEENDCTGSQYRKILPKLSKRIISPPPDSDNSKKYKCCCIL